MVPGVPVSSEGMGAGTRGTVRTRVGYRSCGKWLEAFQHCFWRKATARDSDLAYAVVFNLAALQRPWKHVWNVWTLLFQDTFPSLPAIFLCQITRQQLLFLLLEHLIPGLATLMLCFFICVLSLLFLQFILLSVVNELQRKSWSRCINGRRGSQTKPPNLKANLFEGLAFALWTQIQSSTPKSNPVPPPPIMRSLQFWNTLAWLFPSRPEMLSALLVRLTSTPSASLALSAYSRREITGFFNLNLILPFCLYEQHLFFPRMSYILRPCIYLCIYSYASFPLHRLKLPWGRFFPLSYPLCLVGFLPAWNIIDSQ